MKKRDIFEPRINFKPFEYPELKEYGTAVQHSYWLVDEFNFTKDIQDYRSSVDAKEREVMERSMLAISQVEVSVKRFWSNIYHLFPKPEIEQVGVIFGDSEVRHSDAYSRLLDILGLNDAFLRLNEHKALMNRVEYLGDVIRKDKNSREQSVLSMVMFSVLIEHISLFSQFFIIMSFNKHRNLFKGISNVIEATSKEEEIHGQFGIALYKTVKEEHPEMFTDLFYGSILDMSKRSYLAEVDVVNWIMEKGDLSFLTREEVINYIRMRYNNAFKNLGLEPMFIIDTDLKQKTEWFDIEVLATKETDFFNKRSVDYAKKTKGVTADDLF